MKGRLLSDHCSIHLLELSKWKASQTMSNEDQWVIFSKMLEAGWNCPTTLTLVRQPGPPLRQAMSVLERFSEEDKKYDRYFSRMTALSMEATIKSDLEDALKGKLMH